MMRSVSQSEMKLLCPAKINLTLHILGKRPDGFHELETVMCPVSLYDDLEIVETAPGSGIQLEVLGADLPADTTNLAYKAAARVLEKSGVRQGVSLRLTKRIPMGGGLAGGSSNAASVIRGVNELLDCGLTESELHGIAAGLGSDINFFLVNGPAHCKGRGELVTPLELCQPWRALLINPGFGVPTPWAFQAYASDPGVGETGFCSLALADGGSLFLRNDLEPAVFRKYLWLDSAKQWLGKQAEVRGSLMSGSGATVFALLDPSLDQDGAERLQEKARTYFGGDVWMEVVELLSGKPRTPTSIP
jgi:4-diphosphocytidyl-2-C-methyl-D-erythritol kinase